MFKFLSDFQDRSYRFFYFAVKCVEKVRMIQRNVRLWLFNVKALERKFLNDWKKAERPICRDYLIRQDGMAAEMNLTINLELRSKISMKDRINVAMWMEKERKKFIK